MFASPFSYILPLLLALAANYAMVPPLLRGLKEQSPFDYEVLGSPEPRDIWTRSPSRVQLAFMWFVLRGGAYAVTHGRVRLLAAGYQASYACLLVFFVSYLIMGTGHRLAPH